MLVAEDDEGLGEVLARGLREQGYVVDLVPDGEAAAAYLRFYQYEVAVLDWRMPRLSGFDLVQRLRRGRATVWVPPALAGLAVGLRLVPRPLWRHISR